MPLPLFILFPSLVLSVPPLLFPHGYFDSNKLRPFDAIYLNLMAASNIEYGGTTVEELDALDASRKKVARPEELLRIREEDDTVLNRKPTESAGNKGAVNEGEAVVDKTAPKNPFSRVHLRNLRDDPIEDENPFEEIATRAPPRSRYEFQRLRKQLKREKLGRTRKTRRPNKVQKVRRDRVTTTTVSPTLIPTLKIRRLPNNPYGSMDISSPNIVPLPIPPDFV